MMRASPPTLRHRPPHWPRFRRLLAPDLVYQETGTKRRVSGLDAYVELCQGWREADLTDVRTRGVFVVGECRSGMDCAR
jgi:hypothetical protein